MGIFISEVIEREMDAAEEIKAGGDRFGCFGKESCHLLRIFEMAFGIGGEAEAGFGDGQAVTDGGEDIL